MQQISRTSPPPVSLIAVMYLPNSVRKLRRKSVWTLRTCPDLPPTVSRNFQFSVFGRILLIFETSWDLTQNEAISWEWPRIPQPWPSMHWYYPLKARPGGWFRPPNTLIGQKLTVIRTGQYEAFLTHFLAMFNLPRENVRFSLYIYVTRSVLGHTFWCSHDKYTNRVSFESWDVSRQHLGYGVPLLKQKLLQDT